MNPTQQLSLQLMTQLLNDTDDETFLADYNNIEKGIGPTVDEYLNLMDNKVSINK